MQNKNLLVTLTVATALAVTAVATDAVAAQRDSFPIDLSALRTEAEQHFNAADADGDGLVAAEEFAAVDLSAASDRGRHAGKGRCADRAEKRERRARKWTDAKQESVFSAADADVDVQLSEQEFKALPVVVRNLRQERIFERFDANADGGLSFDEFPSRLTRLQALDSNADGYVSRDEFCTAGMLAAASALAVEPSGETMTDLSDPYR